MLKRCMGKIKRDGYTFHSFLQSDGSAYIDTGLVGLDTLNDDIELSFEPTEFNISTIKAIVGSREGNNALIFWERVGDVYGVYIDGTDYISQISIRNNATLRINENKWYIDTVYYNTKRVITSAPFLLFATQAYENSATTDDRKAKGRLKYFKVKDKINLIPASRDSDGVCGMYDLVTDTFLTNANTVGTFTVGEEKDYYEWVEIKEIKRLIPPRLPKEFQEVEWIELNGEQYIDTGINVTRNLRWECRAMSTKKSVANYCGCGQSANDTRFWFGHSASNGQFIGFGGARQIYGNPFTMTTYIIHNGKGYGYDDVFQSYKATIRPTDTICIGRRSGSQYYRVPWSKIYDDNSNLIQYLIPCYRKSDGVIGMYDIVNNVFHTNQGTGTFLKGADVKDVKFETIRTINKVIDGEIKKINLG